MPSLGDLPGIRLIIPTVKVLKTSKTPISMTIGAIEKALQVNVRLTQVRDTILADLQSYIDSHRQRPREKHTENWRYTAINNLYNVIEKTARVEQTRSNRWRLVIGDYKFLSVHAPYWKIVNYGGKVPSPTTGYFGQGQPPKEGGAGEVFHYTGKKGKNPWTRTGKPFFLSPQLIVPPMYYLNRMKESLINELVRIDASIKASMDTT